MRTPFRYCLLVGAVASLTMAQTPPTAQEEAVRKFEAAVKAAEARAAQQPAPTPAAQLSDIERFREAAAEAEERWTVEMTGLTPYQQLMLKGAISEARTRQTSAPARSPFGFPSATASTPSLFRTGTSGLADLAGQFRNTSLVPPAGFFTPVGPGTRGGNTTRPR